MIINLSGRKENKGTQYNECMKNINLPYSSKTRPTSSATNNRKITPKPNVPYITITIIYK